MIPHPHRHPPRSSASADAAEGADGICRAAALTREGRLVEAGWVVAADGRQGGTKLEFIDKAGRVTGGSDGFTDKTIRAVEPAPPLDTRTVPLDGAGALAVQTLDTPQFIDKVGR